MIDQELIEQFKEACTPTNCLIIGSSIVIYIITWYFLIKTKALKRGDMKIQKAIDEGRTITAALEHRYSTRYYVTNDSHYHRYKYTDLKGKERIYVAWTLYKYCPPDEITLYYNERGKVFTSREVERWPAFWQMFGLFGPPMIAGIILSYLHLI